MESLPVVRTTTALPTVLLLTATLAACGGGGGSADDTSSATSSATGSASSSAPTPRATTSSADADGLTADGSVLDVGTAATVALKPSREAPTGTAQVTVTAIEEVSAEVRGDLADELGDDTAYVLRATLEVTEVGDDFRGIQPSIDLNGRVDGDVVDGASVEVADELGCGPLDLRSSTEVGDTAEFCKVAVAAPGVVMDAAWTTYSDPTALSGDGYVLWVG